MNQMLRQAQALQRKLAQAQEEIAEVEVTGSAGGGTVTAVATGTGDLVRIEIAPETVDPDDVEMLQDLVVAAVNEALRNAREVEQEKLGGLAGGLGLPPGLI
jgi:hypothetical protein